MYKAKRELAKLKFSSVFRSNFRMQRDVLLTLDSLATKNLKELKKDRTNLDYLGNLIDSDSLRGDYISNTSRNIKCRFKSFIKIRLYFTIFNTNTFYQ